MTQVVTINGVEYDTYVSVTQVDEYANGSLTAGAWEALTNDDKGRVIVSVTRWIDSQCWKGEKVDPDQPLAWPRTIGNYASIEVASIQLSLLLAANPDLANQSMGLVAATADGGTKRLKAGSVEIEYFRKLDFTIFGNGMVSPFPVGIMRLIGDWLCDSRGGTWGGAGSKAFGTCEPSRVGTRNKFGYMEPL